MSLEQHHPFVHMSAEQVARLPPDAKGHHPYLVEMVRRLTEKDANSSSYYQYSLEDVHKWNACLWKGADKKSLETDQAHRAWMEYCRTSVNTNRNDWVFFK
jgi:hypothetical protein